MRKQHVIDVPIDVLVGAFDEAYVKAEIAATTRLQGAAEQDSYMKRVREAYDAAMTLAKAMVKRKKETGSAI